jgi:hypothetical protein
MVSFMILMLYLQYPLDRRLDGHLSQPGCSGEEKKITSPDRNITLSCPACSLVTILTELSWLLQEAPAVIYFLPL